MIHAPPLTRDLLLIGGGHAHALVLRHWGMDPQPGVRVTVVNPGPTAPYTGMLPGHVAGHYARDELDIDLVKLARFAGARLILDAACGIDADARKVTLTSGRVIDYDVASIDIGITAEMPKIPGFAEHAIGAKPLDTFARRWRAFRDEVAEGRIAPRVAVIGGGVAGVELALAMHHALRVGGAAPEVTILEAQDDLTGTGDAVRAILKRRLMADGIALRCGVNVERITPDGAELAGGEVVDAALVVGAAGAFPHGWLDETGLPLKDGFIRVDADLRVAGRGDLFAVGDCAHMDASPRPKAGVFAVRAAPVLKDNLRAVLAGRETAAFHPQKRYLKLISLGERAAVAEKFGLALSGAWMWRWKDRIDRAFMDKLNDLPAMDGAPPPRDAALGGGETQPLCAACGAKVAPGALGAALSGLPLTDRDDVLTGPGDDAAVLRTGDARQVLTVDHLRGFTEDPAVMARIAVLHALGDVWAMGARPQVALAAITVPRMSDPMQARTLGEIMRAATETLREAGAALVGGHSTMGAEATYGFTMTGLLDRPAITVAGAREGDALILTRAIGSGTLLAGEMQMKARGRDIAALEARMMEAQGDAAAMLADHATAMTDVTGFGLAGHLSAICAASQVGADLWLGSVPVYSGAEELAEAGVRSTLHAANLAHAPLVGDLSSPRAALLHDPQTAGGFLAAVPEAVAGRLCARLVEAGHGAAIVGQITGPGAPLRVLPG